MNEAGSRRPPPAGLKRSIALANRVRPDAMIVLGSLTWSGSDADFRRVKQMLSGIQAPLYVVPGVKDLADGSHERFGQYFGKENVSGRHLNINGVRLVFAPLYDRTGPAQQKALDQIKTGFADAGDAKAALLFSEP